MIGFLQVVPSFLKELAGVHDELVPAVHSATSVTASTPHAVKLSHGTASQAANVALADLQKVRQALGEALAGVETDLAQKLRIGSDAYANTDAGSAGVLGAVFK